LYYYSSFLAVLFSSIIIDLIVNIKFSSTFKHTHTYKTVKVVGSRNVTVRRMLF
jgi:hypothetical protein